MTICKTCGYSSWCDCPKADDKNVNANKLADLIENEDTLWLEGRLSEIATMLRQQQAEIEVLKNALKNCADLIKKAQGK